MNAHDLFEAYKSTWSLEPGWLGVYVFFGCLSAFWFGKRGWAAAAAVAASVSWWMFRDVLHGAPRIIDAGTYWFQSKHLFGLQAEFPTALFRGRFLLESPDGKLFGIFPPGYPSLLAVFQQLHAPFALGPVIGVALVWRTHALTRELGDMLFLSESKRAATIASVLTAANLCLRYHTADTMSHGLTALMFVLALHAVLLRHTALAGLALGVVACTRLGSLPAIALICAVYAYRHFGWKSLFALTLGAMPGVAWLGYHQWLATGSALHSTQLAYYAVSDGPEGCFGWGLGAARGCMFEHGDYAKEILPHGLDLRAAAHVTGRRLFVHLKDFLGFELTSVFGFFAIARMGRRLPELTMLIPLHMLAYAMFYFDGNYPGAGSRFFAELLPVEFALLGLSLSEEARAQYVRVLCIGYTLAATFHGSPSLIQLRDKFGASSFADASAGPHPVAPHDLAFLLNEGAVRKRAGDLHWMWDEARGNMPAKTMYRIEAEDLWPMLSQSGGYAVPRWEANSCASEGQVLRLDPTRASATVRLRIPFRAHGRALLSVQTHGTDQTGNVQLLWKGQAFSLRHAPGACLRTELGEHEWINAEETVEITSDVSIDIDRITLVDRTP